jgi:hypothetical protein
MTEQIKELATKYNLDPAAIEAVSIVESAGRSGFQSSGLLTVLFEAHLFYRELKKKGLNPDKLMKEYPNLISLKWNRALYKGGDAENTRLGEAAKIDSCAYLCASYGKFQILGMNYAACGFKSVGEFIAGLRLGEVAQIEIFLKFVSSDKNMLAALKDKRWDDFAKLYNGPSYAQNKYDVKLLAAYTKALPNYKVETPEATEVVAASKPKKDSKKDLSV